jgi:two-component system, LytTR family, sensor kinase
MIKSFFKGNRLQFLLHMLAWAVFLLLPLYSVKRFGIGKDFLWLYYINILINGSIFYINYFLLVPKLFFNGKNYKYYISVILLFFFFYFISDDANQMIFRLTPDGRRTEAPPPMPDEKERPRPPGPMRFPMRPPFREIHLFNYGSSSLFLIFFSLGLRILERHSRGEKIQKELEKEKLNTELALLKNQISPHFFFNTLNNIYALISINPGDSQKAVLKLSKMMRYLLYETEHGDIRLINEIEFMTNYIDLMKLRMSDRINLSVIFPEDCEEYIIPPLLFIPFIENAFKHGISNRENSFIEIWMTCSDGNIFFRCANSLSESNKREVINSPGIGLGNVSKRLELLFPKKHELRINKTVNTYEVLLNILLK